MKATQAKTSGELVKKIWGLCNILRGDGVSYHEYISELTYLLFLKIAEETDTDKALPEGHRWRDLVGYRGPDLLTFYRDMLTYLGGHAENRVVQEIYAFPTTVFSHSENLRAVIDGIAKLDWHSVDADGMGDIYEGLLSRNSQDARSGAGQYFTPRPLVDALVRLMRPAAGEVVQDPSCGSGGFLISAQQFSTAASPESTPLHLEGIEIEKGTYRICQMNSFLHGLNAKLILGDALTADAVALTPADVVLANPPFGNKGGSARKTREDLPYRTNNKQLAFLQHICIALKEGGRAAVVVPDNVLFEGGIGRSVRIDLMAECDLHTILRLPNGIFYSQGVNTNVLFFTRRKNNPLNSSRIWVYDLRTEMPRFGKTRPLLPKHFKEFEAVYGADPLGREPRRESAEIVRWRSFKREDIAAREDNLDLIWMTPHEASEPDSSTLQDVASTILFHLQSAMAEIESLMEDLPVDEVEQ